MVTAAMAKRMREARKEGKTLVQIAEEFGVGLSTAARHTNPYAAEKQRAWERARYRRMKENPERYAPRIERNRVANREYQRKITSEGNHEKNDA